MLGSLRQGIAVEDGTQLLIAGVVGVALGVSFAFFPATYIAITIVAFFIVVLAIRSPQYAIIAILFLQSTFLYGDSVPTLGIGDIHIWITDMIIIGLFGLIVVRLLVDRSYKIARSPIVIPLILFLIWVLFTSLRGYWYNGVDRGNMVMETRTIFYFSIALCVVSLVRFEKDFQFIIRWFYLFALVAAFVILVQYGLGVEVSLLTSGKIYSITTTGGEVVTRVQSTIGEGLVTVALIIKAIELFVGGLQARRFYDFLYCSILAASLVATFNRTNWIMVGVALLLAIFLVGSRERLRIFAWSILMVIFISLVIVTIIAIMPDSRPAGLINAGLGRFVTIFQGASYVDPQESTLIWRNFEYTYGIPQVIKNPIAGLGLGANYRPTLSLDYAEFAGERYSHNANLWIAMKTGLVGFALYLWFMITFVVHALKNWKMITPKPQQLFVLGSGLAVLVILFGQNLHPFSLQIGWIPVLSIAIGLSEIIILHNIAKMELNQ
jgi:O-antigen ligase